MDKEIYDKYHSYSLEGRIYVFNFGSNARIFRYTLLANESPVKAVSYDSEFTGVRMALSSVAYFFGFAYAVSFDGVMDVVKNTDYVNAVKKQVGEVFYE